MPVGKARQLGLRGANSSGLIAQTKDLPMRLLPLIALMALIGCSQPLTNPFKGGMFGGKKPVAAAVQPAASAANGIGVAPIQTQTLAPIAGGQAGTAAPTAPRPATVGGAGKIIPNAAPVAQAPSKPAAEIKPILPPTSPEEAACRAQGGRWGAAGKAVAMTCFQPSKDAGKVCSKQSDCSSQCLARSRTCAPFWPIFGCTDILQKDGSQVKLCLD
jgi:hypothetical protein